MSNRVISSLPYARAEEFAIGADHPDGLADTINRALVEAWGFLQHQRPNKLTVSTITIDNVSHDEIDAGCYCQLPSGAVIIIDTPFVLPMTSSTLVYLWAGLRDGNISFEWGAVNTAPTGLYDALQTGIGSPGYSSGHSFGFVGGWVYYNGDYSVADTIPPSTTANIDVSLSNLIPLGRRKIKVLCNISVANNNSRFQAIISNIRTVNGVVDVYGRHRTGYTFPDPVYGQTSLSSDIMLLETDNANIRLSFNPIGSALTYTFFVIGYEQ